MADAKLKMDKSARSPPRSGEKASLVRSSPEQQTQEAAAAATATATSKGALKGILKQRGRDSQDSGVKKSDGAVASR
jgi:hypothetical protein